jgi:hypothetical protein
MKTNVVETEMIDATDATSDVNVVAEDTSVKDTSEKEISKTVLWARAHKGFIEILDPELKAQMSFYRKQSNQMVQSAF